MDKNEIEENETIDASTELAVVPQETRAMVEKLTPHADLVRFSEIGKKLKLLKRKFGDPLKFAIKDEEGFNKVKAIKKDLVDFRTDTEKERKDKVKPFNDTVDFYNLKYFAPIAELKKLEEPYKLMLKNYEDEKKRKEEEEKKQREMRLYDRLRKVEQAGMSFDGNYYCIGNPAYNIDVISLGVVAFETMTDETFEIILSQVVEKNAQLTAIKERIEKERLEQERLRREKEEADKRLLLEQQEKLRQDQEDLRKKYEELDNLRQSLRQEKLGVIEENNPVVVDQPVSAKLDVLIDDIAKWEAFKARLERTLFPEMSTEKYKANVDFAMQLIGKIISIQ